MTDLEILSAIREIIPADRVNTDPETLQHASVDRFKKYQDVFGVFTVKSPICIVMAESTEEISKVITFCNENRVNVIPKTGGSSIEGGLENGAEQSIVLDGSGMNHILKIDETNMLVTCECGVCLEMLEQTLRPMGLTTGHSPQSKPLAQMGGLVATRSIGQFSTLYGGIEDMLIGLEMVMADGSVARIKNVSRRSTGCDIRHIALGNEGALCYITEVTVKMFRYMPENSRFYSWLLDDMKTGFAILREVMVQGYKPSFCRLYDFQDGEYYFSHFSEGRPVLIFMTEGPAEICKVTGEAIERIVAGFHTYKRVPEEYITKWYAGLNWNTSNVQRERDEIKATHNIGFTTEISALWSDVNDIYETVIRRITEEIPDITMVGGHTSHSYMNGTNLYFMYYYNVVDCPVEEEISKYHNPINKIIVEETLAHGGSMVHHHGVGKYRVPWIREEYGSSYAVFAKLKAAYDPNGIMNRGTLFPAE